MSEHDSRESSSRWPRPAAQEDQSEYLDIPTDAGKHRDALVTVLLRVPDGWSRSISCGPGWYALIAQLHLSLCDLDRDYEVLQVKEKFGTLRYYARTQTDDSVVQEQFESLIAEAETRSTQICQWCGQPGQLSASENHGGRWYDTLCRADRDAYAESGRIFKPV